MSEEIVSEFEIGKEQEENDCGIWIQICFQHDAADLDFLPAKEGNYKLIREK